MFKVLGGLNQMILKKLTNTMISIHVGKPWHSGKVAPW